LYERAKECPIKAAPYEMALMLPIIILRKADNDFKKTPADVLGRLHQRTRTSVDGKSCQHTLRPNRWGLGLRQKHFKKIYEEMTESSKSDFSSVDKGEMASPD
jgi:hypothetical protein